MVSRILNLPELAARVHVANKKWWVSLDTGQPITRNTGELIMLVISELAEAMEGHRKSLQDDKLPHRTMYEVELADAFIRVLDIFGGMQIPFVGGLATMRWSLNTGENLIKLATVATMAYSYNDRRKELGRLLERFLAELMSLCEHDNLDLAGAFEEKMAFNAVRVDHTHEARKAEGGKKY